ncbi:MAG: hypothetical protein ACE5GO_09910 [Anaerolineales bacterium]
MQINGKPGLNRTKRSMFIHLCIACLFIGSEALVGGGPSATAEPLQIGSRLELFVDDWLIDTMDGARLVLQEPIDVGKVFDLNLPWEGEMSNYAFVFKDGDKVRMYYRGARRMMQKGRPGSSNICYAESSDGVNWTKPNLGIYEFAGTKENNITYIGDGTPGWYCFKDENPDADPQRRYKAICGLNLSYGGPKGIMSSPDGFHWVWWRKEPIIKGGPLDGLNNARWYPQSKMYMAYVRNWVDRKRGFGVPPDVDAPPSEYNTWYIPSLHDRVRAIALITSKDFVNWTRQQWLIYDEGTPLEHLYTNSVSYYFRAPHVYLGFPMRFVPDRVVITGWGGLGQGPYQGLLRCDLHEQPGRPALGSPLS